MRRFSGLARHAVVGGCVLMVGSAAVAIAAIPDSSGTFTGCYRTSGGQLRVIDSSASCRATETRITWSQQGLRGATGAQGPQGEPGPQGDPGIDARYVHADLPVETSESSATTQLSGGEMPGWGQLEGACIRERRESGTVVSIKTVIRNESGENLSVAALDNDSNDLQYGQEPSNGQTAILARMFVETEGVPYTGGGGATVVRRSDRKVAAFRVVHRLEGEHCEFDISVIVEP